MIYLHMRFPGFKLKTLTFSYDDGTIFDKRLVELFNKYGVKGTFNVNSGLFGEGERIAKQDYYNLLKNTNHEVAVHGVKHIYLTEVPTDIATQEVLLDRIALEKLFKKQVRGMAYAFGNYNDKVVDILDTCGINYCRTTNSTENFNMPDNWLTLHPTCHHSNPKIFDLAKSFLDIKVEDGGYWKNKPKMFYIWGHSYEFRNNLPTNSWEHIEKLLQMLSGKDDIWYATNGEIFEYSKAFKRLEFSADHTRVYNPTSTDIYFNYFGKDYLIKAGKTIVFSNGKYI